MSAGSFTGTNYALQETPVMSTLPAGKLVRGNVYCSTDICYATGSSLDTGSTLLVGKLPKGAIPLYTVIYPIDTATYGAPDAMTNAVTGTLGYSGDTNALGDVSTLQVATPQVVAPIPDGTTLTSPLIGLDEDEDIYLTTGGAALTATEGVCVKIFFTVD